ncbi:MAG: helical backbone metal receptor, partial [Planctomycetota bacterium]
MSSIMIDDLGRSIHIDGSASARVVSLCPSITETLFDLGCGTSVVGRTKYCIHPSPAVDSVPSIGGTKKIDLKAVLALAPSLVLAVKEENTREDVEALIARGLRVFVFDVQTVKQAMTMIRRIGDLLSATDAADAL